MTVHFSPDFDSAADPLPLGEGEATSGRAYLGAHGLLNELELRFGLIATQESSSARVVAYRNALNSHLSRQDRAPFYQAAFCVDPYAVAADLLEKRDELLLAGWDPTVTDSDAPPRLATLAAVEAEWDGGRGFADRFLAIEEAVGAGARPSALRRIVAHPFLPLLPAHWRRLLRKLTNVGLEVASADDPGSLPDGEAGMRRAAGTSRDLDRVVRIVSEAGHAEGRRELAGDGSVVILRASNDLEASAAIGRLLATTDNTQDLSDGRWTIIAEGHSHGVGAALTAQGVPSIGSADSDPSAPAALLCRTVPALLFEPPGIHRIAEALFAGVLPIDPELARRLLRAIQEEPGIGGQAWQAALDIPEEWDAGRRERAMEQYRELFERSVTLHNDTIRLEELIEAYEYFLHFARRRAAREEENGQVWISAAGYLSDIVDSLKAVLSPGDKRYISELEVSQLVERALAASSSRKLCDEEGRPAWITHPGSLTGRTDTLIWLPFVRHEPAVRRFWSNDERAVLLNAGVTLPAPDAELQRYRELTRRALSLARERLILVCPETVAGEDAETHPFMTGISQAMSGLEGITTTPDTLSRFFEAYPEPLRAERLALPQPVAEWNIGNLARGFRRDSESFSSLENLVFYPHRWLLRYVARLRRSDLHEVPSGPLLYGKVAHAVFREFFGQYMETPIVPNEDAAGMWVAGNFDALLRMFGLPLLEEGMDHERERLRARLIAALETAIRDVLQQEWKVAGTEVEKRGTLDGTELSGRIDLLLQRRGCFGVMDHKWSRFGQRRDELAEGRDLQLSLYALLAKGEAAYADTGYLFLENGRLLAAASNGFTSAVPAGRSDYQRAVRETLLRTEKTIRTRHEQLDRGSVPLAGYQHENADGTPAAGDGGAADAFALPDKPHTYDEYATLMGWTNP